MKRVLSFLLAAVMVLALGGCAEQSEAPTKPTHSDATVVGHVNYGPHRPVGVFAVEEQMRDKDFWAQDTPIADRNKAFYEAKDTFFDYFYNLWGFDVTLSRSDTGRFPDTELLHSVCIRLSMESESGSANVFTKAELNAAAKKYYGQTIEKFTGCSQCSYKSDTGEYTWNSGCVTFPGNFMVLRQLRVQEDGLCVGIFDRSHEQYYTGELGNQAMSPDVVAAIKSGAYDELSRVDTVTVTFREGKTENGAYHLQILSMYAYDGLGSNTKG